MIVSYTWDVSEDSASEDAGGASGADGGGGVTKRSAAVIDPLGCGITRPFRRGSADFVTASGVPKVIACVGQILGTDLGSIPWRPAFGTRLSSLRHKANNNVLSDIARVDIANALSQWEPRVQLLGLNVQKVRAPGAGPNERNVMACLVDIKIGGESRTVRAPM